MSHYLNFVQRYAKFILLILAGITVYFAYMTAYLTEDSNPYLLPKDHPARSSIYSIRENVTGTYDSIYIALHNKETILNSSSIAALFELTQSFKQLHFIEDSDIDSLEKIKIDYSHNTELFSALNNIIDNGLNTDDIHALRDLNQKSKTWNLKKEDQFLLESITERLDPVREMAGLAASENLFLETDETLRVAITVDDPKTPLNTIKLSIENNELTEYGLISPNEKTALIVIELSLLETDAVGHVRAYEKVKNIIDQYKINHPEFVDDIYIAGIPVFFAEQKRILDRDMAVLFPLVLLLIAITLVLFFRSWLGVAIPLINVVMCTVWTMGAMAIVGIPVDLITSVLPVFLITICSSDAIHVMAEYYQQRKRHTQKTAIENTMHLMASPVILTTITTCVTFSVSTLSAIENLRNFGMSMSFGMFVAMLISLLLIPAWLSLLSDKKLATVANNKPKESIISRLLLKVIQPVMAYRSRYLIGFLFLVVALITIGLQVRIDDIGSAYFNKNNPYRIADTFINQHNIASTSPGWIEIDTGEENGALTPEAVYFIDQLETFIHQQDTISYSYSIARYIRRINFVLNNLDEQHNRLPNAIETFTEIAPDTGETYTITVNGKDIIRQSVLFYENGGGSDLTNVLSEDFSKTVLLYTMNTMIASDYQAFLDQLRPWLDANIPSGMSYQLAGSPVIWTAVLNELVSSQFHSIFIAFICVIAIMSLWMRSIKLGVLGSLPLLVTVIFYYAAMTLLDIELNIGTAIISFLVLGIVDYSAHYLLRTRHGVQQGLAIDEALKVAISYSGRSIIINVLIFSIGFIALLFSEFQPIVDLGMLVGLSLFISGIMSIFLITLLAPWLMNKK